MEGRKGDDIFQRVLEIQFAQTQRVRERAGHRDSVKMYGSPLIRGNWKLLYDARKRSLSSFARC